MAKYHTLVRNIEKLISQGEYAPGDPLPSIRQLMTSEKTSSATVQKSLKTLQEKGLVDSHPNRGYFVIPNGGNKPRLAQIACLVGTLNSAAEDFIKGVSATLKDTKYAVASFAFGHDIDHFNEIFDKVNNFNPTGIILNILPRRLYQIPREKLGNCNIPMVTWGSAQDNVAFDCVSTDYYIVGSILAKRIIARGRKKVQFLESRHRDREETQAYIHGLTDVFEEGGIKFSEQNVFMFEPNRGFGKHYDPCIDAKDRVTEMINSGIEMDSIVCSQEYSAAGAIKAIEEAGLRIPDDIAVMSGDRCAFLDPMVNRKITSVDPHTQLMGRIACQLLLQRIENPAAPVKLRMVGGELINGDTD